jgi:chemotaxis protein methyltransferase CheR
VRMGQLAMGKTSPLALTDDQCDRFSRLVQERFGLFFSDKRRVELERGVLYAFAATNCASLDEFYYLLHDPASTTLLEERLVNALTICETHFFRDAAQFDAIRQHVLPQIIERRRSLRTLRIWSVGCASGEEPYSIAILLRELIPNVDEWSITILGTDINTQALERARRAVFSEWAFREDLARQMQSVYFTKQENGYALSSEIRRMVTFNRLNLMEDRYPSYATNTTFMDLILCRNVTIYFPLEVTQQVIDRLHSAQTDGGWLVVGHSEPSLNTYRRYQVRNYPGCDPLSASSPA